ncbi:MULTISPECIES: hypothetical protein [Ramlibacter]|uniref:Uncharacterized protein n=1 Tax=Ramlibacter pinisoli TaxID=2682844 RepID=A0A6N8J0V1_9BURK|nr:MULTISPECIES: hypothetical protein [Ramlibacter]MBA2962523.1 hypothetical protein [Ramlibacter sp. CGMCC 1.13660]MVQ32465.1 hypothetical protein [Ramlibacter pinisoli]
MDPDDQTASLMTPAKLAQVSAARAPVSPSAFLDQMAADVGHQHVRRLAELRAALEREARASSAASVRPPLEELAQALPQVDFGLLEPRGWWAGLTGKNRSAGAVFAAGVDAAEGAARSVGAGVGAAQKAQQPHAVTADRALVEVEVEYQALDRLIDQGARWLQTMRSQLQQRGDPGALDANARRQVDEDAARCELLVSRLKALRAAAAASQQARQQALATAERRSELTRSTLQAVASEVTGWRSRLSALAAAAAEGRAAGRLDAAREAHEQLQRRLAAVLADCEQLRSHEAALLDALDAMRVQLDAVA